MELLTHLSINLFPIVMLLAVFANNKKRADRTSGNRMFNILTLSVLAFMVADILCAGINDVYRPGRGMLYVLYMLYMLLIVMLPFVWLMYVYRRLATRNPEGWLDIVCFSVIVLTGVTAVLILTVPWTHLFFYITEEGVYKAGICEWFPTLVSILLFFGNVIVTGIAYTHEVTKEGRREVTYMLEFCMVSLVGIAVEHLFEGWWTMGPFSALAVFLIYINTQNHQITTDALTGLNNRREFDAHLTRKIELCPEHEWGLLLIDVDEFKEINDRLGHAVGDEALWETADILRRVFEKGRAFVARYGGDEFTVIGDWFGEKEITESIEKVRQEVQKFNANRKEPYELSLSIGYAFWHEAGRREENLIKEADKRMYEEKVRKKKVRV